MTRFRRRLLVQQNNITNVVKGEALVQEKEGDALVQDNQGAAQSKHNLQRLKLALPRLCLWQSTAVYGSELSGACRQRVYKALYVTMHGPVCNAQCACVSPAMRQCVRHGRVCDEGWDGCDLLVKRLVADSDKDQGLAQRHTLANLHPPPPSHDIPGGTELGEDTLFTLFAAWPERKTEGLRHEKRARATLALALTSLLLPPRLGWTGVCLE